MTTQERERILARYHLRAKVFEVIAAERTRQAGPTSSDRTQSVRIVPESRMIELSHELGATADVSRRLDDGRRTPNAPHDQTRPLRSAARAPESRCGDAAVRLLVADDHPAIIEAIARYVAEEEGIELVPCAASGEQALRLIAEHRPDVVVLDLRMPELGGLDVLKRLEDAEDPPAVIVFTAYQDRSMLLEALDAGARGFLPKETSLAELMEAVRRVAAGETCIEPMNGGTRARRRDAGELPALTGREREILLLLANGMRNERVAQTLSISPLTVRMHVRHAMEKLNATTRTQAVATALRVSLIA